MSPIDKFVKILDDHQYVFLTLSMVIMLVGTPFFVNGETASFWIHFMLSLVLMGGLFAGNSHDKFLFTSVFLGIFTLVFSWVDYAFFDDRSVTLAYLLTGLVFFVFVTISLLNAIHDDRKVNSDLFFGSVSGYFMIGFTGAFVFAIIDMVMPWSFSITMDSFKQFPEFIYYSFVNMTTLGYGDIIPLSSHAKSRSVLFTIAGQMYLIILLWVVVGKYIREKVHWYKY